MNLGIDSSSLLLIKINKTSGNFLVGKIGYAIYILYNSLNVLQHI